MMDVMRIDDHARLNKKGRVCNPTNQKESQIQKEIIKSGILNLFPNVDIPLVNATTELPTEEDHNYRFYYTGFERTVKKHIDSIPLYRANHPDCKTVFFVFDESSGYVQIDNPDYFSSHNEPGEIHLAHPYIHFLDRRFLQIFQRSDIDYLIWFSPFKYFESDNKFPFPIVAVYDVKNYKYTDVIDYNENVIVSTEV